DRKVSAAIVDNVAFECYQRRKPTCGPRLRIIQQSETFPASAVAYRQGALDAETLQRFRTGMLNAHKTIVGKHLMTLFKLTSFEAVPGDYQEMLTNIVKAYPSP